MLVNQETEYGLAVVCFTNLGSMPGNGNEYITTGSNPGWRCTIINDDIT